MRKRLIEEFKEFKLLLRCIPSVATVFFVIAVFMMNLLANKSISLGVDWLALDAGIVVSWVVFLVMDVVTKHFGPKAATELSIFAIVVNLFCCFITFLGSIIPGVWGESFVEGGEGIINHALDATFGGTWYVVLGSTVAFTVSAVVNNSVNWLVGKAFKRNADSFIAFILRAYVSTAIGQFVDNLVFALIVSHFFFGWSIVQCLTCALTGMVAELLFEVAFSYFGYLICKKWKKEGVGASYFALRSEPEEV